MSIWGNPVTLGGGGGAGCWRRLRFYDHSGALLLRTEYVADGGDCGYGAGRGWATAQGGAAVPGVTQNVRASRDLYLAEESWLPYSAGTVCEAYAANFTSGAQTWGAGSAPLTLGNAAASAQSDGSVLLPVKSSGTPAYVDLGAADAPYTAYIVAKSVLDSNAYGRVLCALNARNTGQGMLLYGSPVVVASWGSDSSSGVSAADYFAAALQFAVAGSGVGCVGSAGSWITKAPTHSGRYLTIGRSDLDAAATNADPRDTYVRYFGVVPAAEDEATVRANLAWLEQAFVR